MLVVTMSGQKPAFVIWKTLTSKNTLVVMHPLHNKDFPVQVIVRLCHYNTNLKVVREWA
jgi:hypothetical protein